MTDLNNIFKNKAVKVHNNFYSYDNVDYVNAKTKVIITCPKHGDFLQNPNTHLKGSWCPKCSRFRHKKIMSKNNDYFIKKANTVHNNFYNYDKTVYVKMADKVVITCLIHGDFTQVPQSHLNGSGCPECGRLKHTSNTQTFVAAAIDVHGTKYLYDDVNYVNRATKVKIGCPEHGYFEQRPDGHLRGKGCSKCASDRATASRKKDNGWFIEKANGVHNTRYDYSKVEYVGNKTKVTIICTTHGEFKQAPSDHMAGQGCPECGKEKSSKSRRLTYEQFENKARNIHNNKYKYFEYINYETPIRIECSIHGIFNQTPDDHLTGKGCSECGAVTRANSRRSSVEEFITKANKIHNNFYSYDKVEYVRNDQKVIITCPEHGDFKQIPAGHLNGFRCIKCARSGTSIAQIAIAEYIKNFGFEVEDDVKGIIGLKHLDILIPERKLAIEYNGVYWHNDKKRGREYHYEKQRATNIAGYELIMINEDEWLEKENIVKKIIRHRLGISCHGLPANRLTIKTINESETNEFLINEHIDGTSYFTIALGAYSNDKLVAVMTFSLLENSWELQRFATDYNSHAGIFSKLLNYFVKNNNPKEIVTVSDNRWFSGKIYEKLGFSLVEEIPVDFDYVKASKRFHKSIESDYGITDRGLAWDTMQKLGFLRIWNCGKRKWLYKPV